MKNKATTKVSLFNTLGVIANKSYVTLIREFTSAILQY